MSEEHLKEPRTPLSGSSEDSYFHFHPRTSPSESSSDISEECGEFCDFMMSDGHRSSACFSTNEESSEWLETDKNKSTSQDTEISEITNISVECSYGIKRVSEITTEKSRKISARYSKMHLNSFEVSTLNELFDRKKSIWG